MAVTAAPTRRERQRAATQAEIDATARALLDREGPAGVTVAAVAREMDMTAPALYRYVASRADLLTRLITAGYDEVADRLARARDSAPVDDPGARTVAVATAWREWCLAETSMFALLYGSPLAGYEAPEDGPTTPAARRVGQAFWSVMLEASRRGQLGEPLVDDLTAPVEQMTADWYAMKALPEGLGPRQVQAGFIAFALLVGCMTVEALGHMPPMQPDQAREAYLVKVATTLRITGVPWPRSGPLAR